MERREQLCAGILLLVVAYHLATLGSIPSMPTDDDGAYAAAAYQMWQTGRPGVPGYRRVVGMDEEIYLLGQIGGWVQGMGMALWGVGIRAALVPSWVAGLLLLWVWLIPVLLGQPVLRLYLLAEHGDCPRVADMFLNTRTTFTNRIVRFLAWNMPYHVEHHVAPTVPFHRLPDLHARMRDHLAVTAEGYAAFTRDYLARRL